jgi:cysteine-rich repeat protein
VVSPSQTKNGICICETKEGYFWEASSGKSEPCDGDGDGWIRQTALDAMRSDDPVIKANARCASVLHRVDMLGLITEQGVALPIDITTVLAPSIFKAATLYQDGVGGVVLTEPLLYDSEELLAGQVATGGFPNFAGGRAPKAAELNPLTKSCVSAGADFNGNGIADVEEWPGHAKAKPDAISQLAIKFSYWIELHRGWWAKAPPPVTLPVGATPVDPAEAATPVGVYFIAEKHRALLAPGPTQLALVEPTTTSQGYWRQCRRQVASDYKTAVNDGATTIGFDFASWSHQSPAWGQGMTHHSQFHCAVIAAVDAVLSESEKQFKIRSSELDKKWTVNECKYGASSHAPLPISATQITAFDDKSQARNPSDPVASGCSVAAPSTGAAYWLVARYTPYIKAEDYGRGCINECIDAVVDTCPYVLNDPHSMYACIGNKDNSGAAMCTCNNGYYGEPAKGCAPKCGDGIIATSNEVCDDGNTNTNDGCSDACQCEGWSTPVLSSKVGPNGYSYKTGTCQCGEDDLKPKVELAGVCGGGGSPKAVDLGTIAKASTPEIVTGGRIRFGESEDWFRVYAPDLQQVVLNGTGTELYNLAVDLSLDSTPGSDAFVMDIFRGPKEDLSCQKAEPVCSSETQHSWKSVFEKCMRRPGMDGTCGGKPCTGSTSGWTKLPKGAVKPTKGDWFYGYGSPTAPMHCPDYSAYYYIRVKRAAKTPTTCGGYKLVLKSAAN